MNIVNTLEFWLVSDRRDKKILARCFADLTSVLALYSMSICAGYMQASNRITMPPSISKRGPIWRQLPGWQAVPPKQRAMRSLLPSVFFLVAVIVVRRVLGVFRLRRRRRAT